MASSARHWNNPSIALHSSSNFIDFQKSVVHPMTKFQKGRVPDIFKNPCDNLQESIALLEEIVQDFIHSQCAGSSLEALIMSSRLHRTKSDLVQKCMDLFRIVNLFSCEWKMTSDNILALEQDYFKHWFVLDVAIRKMAVLENRIQKEKAEYALGNWIRLAKKVLYTEYVEHGESEAKGIDDFAASNALIATAKCKRLQERVDLLKRVVETSKMVKELQENILETPQDVQLQREAVFQFSQYFHQHNPGYQYVTSNFKNHPGIIYLSSRTGAFTLRSSKNIGLKRSKSCEFLSLKLKKDQVTFVEYLDWRFGLGNDLKSKGNPFRVTNKMIRLNSFDFKYDIETLKAEIFEPNDIDAFEVEERWLKGQNVLYKDQRGLKKASLR